MNPFKYGKVVSDPYFVNRKNEINEISLNLRDGNNLILYAPRRYGKTSLVLKILENLKQKSECLIIYFDFFQVLSEESFIELYAKKILQLKKSSIENSLSIFKNFISGIIPAVTVDDFGKPVFTFSFQPNSDRDKTLLDVLDLPNKIFNDRSVVVVFDEFQEITKLKGEKFENQLRSVIQFHKNVSYVFMGSQTHLLFNMFKNKKRAFYNIGKLMRIDKIPEKEMMIYLKKRYDGTGIQISEDIIAAIIKISENIPYYTQFLAYEIWQISYIEKIEINDEVLYMAVDKIINHQSDYYFELFEKLSKYQKKLLLVLTKSSTNIYSKEFSVKYNLSSGSSTQRAIGRLVESGIIEKIKDSFYFSDPFFKRFLLLRFKA